MAETKQVPSIVDSTHRHVVKKMSTGIVIIMDYDDALFSDNSRTCSFVIKVVDGDDTYTGGGEYKNNRFPNMSQTISMHDITEWLLVMPDVVLTFQDVCVVTYYGPSADYKNQIAICLSKPSKKERELSTNVDRLTGEVASLKENCEKLHRENVGLTEQLEKLKCDLVYQISATAIAAETYADIKTESEKLREENVRLTALPKCTGCH